MNIRKHLKRLFLASTALFWASCGDDANSSSPTVAPETNIPSDSAETIVPSDPLQQNETDKTDSIPSDSIPSDSVLSDSIPSDSVPSDSVLSDSIPSDSVPSASSQCHEAEKIHKKLFNPRIMDNPVTYATYDADGDAQVETYILIEKYLDENDLSISRNELYKQAPECLTNMLDTLDQPYSAYGTLVSHDSVATKFVCDDGTTYVNEEYLNYQKDLKQYEENTAIYNETYNKVKEERVAELQKQLDDCISHPEETEED